MLFIDFEILRMISTMVITGLLLAANIEMEPCNVAKLNTLRSGTYLAALFSGSMSLWAYFESPSYRLPLVILCVGLVAILLGTVIMMSGYLQRKRERVQSTLTKAFLNSATQSKEFDHLLPNSEKTKPKYTE
jgi:hypothetical protein